MIALAIVMISCAGCVSTDFEANSGICPPVRVYPPAFSAALADAVAELPPASPIVAALSDYMVLRAQARACSRTD